MKLIKPKVEILDKLDERDVVGRIATVARTCYKSEDMRTADKAYVLVRRLIDSKHDAMLEFVDITVKFTTDRAIANELVRHRLASYAQESTRYCNYSKDKFGNELTFIIPSWLNIPEGDYTWWNGDWVDMDKLKINLPDNDDATNIWLHNLKNAEYSYIKLIDEGWKPQQARSVLPLCTKTEITMKANLREWRHFFKLRCSTAAHPDMRVLALDLLKQFHEQIPIVFDDLHDQFYGNKRSEDNTND